MTTKDKWHAKKEKEAPNEKIKSIQWFLNCGAVALWLGRNLRQERRTLLPETAMAKQTPYTIASSLCT
jgi:hypothetical protein